MDVGQRRTVAVKRHGHLFRRVVLYDYTWQTRVVHVSTGLEPKARQEFAEAGDLRCGALGSNHVTCKEQR